MDTREANGGSGTAVLRVAGMTCGGCAGVVTRVLSRVPGVRSAEVDLAAGRAMVTGGARPEDLVAAVQAAGYRAQLSRSGESGGERNERDRSGS
jgi:Cu+-exporting ATPase